MEAQGRVIVAERDQAIARLLKLVCEREGLEVRVADSAARVKELFAESPAEVLLLSRGLPEGGGIELMRSLRAGGASFEALLMSLDPTAEVTVEAMEQGAFDLLVMPFTNLKLIAHRVRSALEKERALRERDTLARKLLVESEAVKELHAKLDRAEANKVDVESLTGVDPLTGIKSERAILERFRAEAARSLRYGRPFSIAACCIEGEKTLSQRLGAEGAREVLRAVASLGHAAIRDADDVGRRGDLGLLFLFPETGKSEGCLVAKRLGALVSETAIARNGIRVNVRFGVASLPSDTMNADTLLERATQALSRASSDGGPTVFAFEL